MIGDAQFVSDVLLMDHLLRLHAAGDSRFIKQAGVMDWFKSAFSSIAEQISKVIDTSSTETIIESILKLIESGGLFLIHPALGIIDTVFQMNGYSLTGFLMKLFNGIKAPLLSGQPVTSDQVNQAALALAPSLASTDFLAPIRKLAEEGKLYKTAGIGNFLSGIVKTLTGKQKSGFLASMVSWIWKAILWGVGLVWTGKTVKGLIGGEPEKIPEEKPQQIQGLPKPESVPGGFTVFKQDADNVWKYDYGSGTPEDILLKWTYSFYPSLIQAESLITSNPAFIRTKNLLARGWGTAGSATMPEQFTSWIDIVNSFAGDVFRQLRG